MQCTEMIIGEVLTDDHVKEIVRRMQEHVRNLPELAGHSILAEEDGRMVILITDWSSRQDCLQYYASKANRQFVAATQHMLVGSYVVKLFQNQTERSCVYEPRNS
jgi:heme-degrading monooxygenase HmoA